jgi:hypothetical protein
MYFHLKSDFFNWHARMSMVHRPNFKQAATNVHRAVLASIS